MGLELEEEEEEPGECFGAAWAPLPRSYCLQFFHFARPSCWRLDGLGTWRQLLLLLAPGGLFAPASRFVVLVFLVARVEREEDAYGVCIARCSCLA